ncbi:MAG: RsmD family RNA methyltransferase [Candidatus Atribacteria bacterium]|nr:RsmD family RNA methyltransferase [Candidatus Atribacteria bacterium]
MAPPGFTTRPMQGFLRKALFELLKDVIPGSVVMDLFAGSGSIGLEALSRGAVRAIFMEREPRISAILKRNIALCGYEAVAQVITADFLRLRKFPELVEKPHLLFADPHFRLNQVSVLQKLYNSLDMLGGPLVILRYPTENDPLTDVPFFRSTMVRTYGRSVLVFGYLHSSPSE